MSFVPVSSQTGRVLGYRGGIVAAVGKERPRCRRMIIAYHLRPWLDQRGIWDGYFALNETNQMIALSGGMQKQMRRMILEGYWIEKR